MHLVSKNIPQVIDFQKAVVRGISITWIIWCKKIRLYVYIHWIWVLIDQLYFSTLWNPASVLTKNIFSGLIIFSANPCRFSTETFLHSGWTFLSNYQIFLHYFPFYHLCKAWDRPVLIARLPVSSSSYCLSLALPFSACISQYTSVNTPQHNDPQAESCSLKNRREITQGSQNTLVMYLRVGLVLIHLAKWGFPHFHLLKFTDSSDCNVFFNVYKAARLTTSTFLTLKRKPHIDFSQNKFCFRKKYLLLNKSLISVLCIYGFKFSQLSTQICFQKLHFFPQ